MDGSEAHDELIPAARGDGTPGMALLRAFEGEDPLVILDRIVARDPLDLGRRCSAWLREHALLLDPSRLFGESLIEVAAEASLGDLPADGRAWLEQRLQRAATRLLRRDAEAERNGTPPGEDNPHAFLVEYFGVTPGTELLASVRFNALPQSVRTTYFDVVVEDHPPRVLAGRTGRRPEEIVEDAWEGMMALGIVQEVDKEFVVAELLGGNDSKGDRR
ncbi:MAG TPA: hypothetical protein ENJ09_02620 [Planctomycetes bacterium]|nr:hypothetical protein [Planctomycetota bacterium]